MTQNPHLGSNALLFLDSITPDTPSARLAERQEIFRIALSQAMREVRQKKGLTQKELAKKLNIGQSWVSKLESANNDHTFESVLQYLEALGADFEAIIMLDKQKLRVAAARLEMTSEEAYNALKPVWETVETYNSANKNNPNCSNFSLISPEKQNQCSEAQKIAGCNGFWG